MKKFALLLMLLGISYATVSAQSFNNNAGYTVNNMDYQFQNQGSVINVQYDYPYYIMNNRLTMNDLYGYSKRDLRIMRNSIYAAYGYIFKSDDLRAIFSRCSWYRPRYKNEGTVYNMMTSTQKANVNLIKKRENQLK